MRSCPLGIALLIGGLAPLGCNTNNPPPPDAADSSTPAASQAPQGGAEGLPKTLGWDMPSAMPTGLSMLPGAQRWTLPDGGRVIAGPLSSPQSLAELARSDPKARCKEGERKHLFVVVEWGSALSLPIEVALNGRYGGTIDRAGASTRGISPRRLLELDSKATAFRVWPCQGAAIDLPVRELTEGDERYWLQTSSSLSLSLVDIQGEKSSPLARNIAAIGLLRTKDKP